MKPVLIFRHIACEGPGYLATFLGRNNIPFSVIDLYKGTEIPLDANNYSGLVFMGGPMSANDKLSWINTELDLIRDAHQQNIPILGHCLGGQLISKALGGEVMPNAVPEIGWFPVAPVDHDTQQWMQELSFTTDIFHWHSEMFVPPERAIPLFKSEHCPNQGFMLDNILALQFHVEMEIQNIAEWLEIYADEIPEACKSVQTNSEMLFNLEQRIFHLHKFADSIYAQWLNGFNK
jgi:GMP synthase-like glutamine amidotransferase